MKKYINNFNVNSNLIWQVKSNIDVSNFDVYPILIEDSPTELSGWDKDFDCSNMR